MKFYLPSFGLTSHMLAKMIPSLAPATGCAVVAIPRPVKSFGTAFDVHVQLMQAHWWDYGFFSQV